MYRRFSACSGLSNLPFEDDFNPCGTVAHTALQHERAEARENNGYYAFLLITGAIVRHCSSTLSSDRIFITTQYSYIFYHIFMSYFIYYFRLKGEYLYSRIVAPLC